MDIHHHLWFRLVMSSLKTSLNNLSPIFGMSPAAIYERQRALVRLGALRAIPGKGPGSGVDLSAQNLATLIIGCAASITLSGVDDRIIQYIKAPSSEKSCPLTERKTFRDAIQAVLEQKFSKKFTRPEYQYLCFNLQAPGGFIFWGLGPVPVTSSFGANHEPGKQPGIDFRSYISNEALISLRELLLKKEKP